MALFLLSVAGVLIALGVFFWYDTTFLDVFEVGDVLGVAMVLLSELTLPSGLLFR